MHRLKVILIIPVTIIYLQIPSVTVAQDKVVVVPLTSFQKVDPLQGEGRPGVGLLNHTSADGYCTSSSGVKFALSDTIATWTSAASVCPAGTRVCSLSDLPSSGNCDISASEYGLGRDCSGNGYGGGPFSSVIGWVSDREAAYVGRMKRSSDLSLPQAEQSCGYFRVWCCWR